MVSITNGHRKFLKTLGCIQIVNKSVKLYMNTDKIGKKRQACVSMYDVKFISL